MTRATRIVLRWVVGSVVAFAVISLGLFFLLRSSTFRNWCQTELSRRSGFDIRFVELGFRPPFRIVAATVDIAKAGALSFRAGRLSATISPFDLLSPTLQRVDIETPVLQIDVQEILKPTDTASGKV